MNPAHLHLLVNHLPIVGAFLAVPLLGLALWKRQDTGALRAAVLVLVFAAIGAGASMRTGEEAEEAVEASGWMSERLAHDHEERAELATPLSVVTALAGVALLIWSERKKVVNAGLVAGLGLLSVASAGAMAWVGSSGGVIRHDEIRDAATAAAAARGGGEDGEEEGDD